MLYRILYLVILNFFLVEIIFDKSCILFVLIGYLFYDYFIIYSDIIFNNLKKLNKDGDFCSGWIKLN